MNQRPVIITQQVCMQYQSREVNDLMKAANELPPYEIQEFARYIRIDCYSLFGRGWRCAFIISKSTPLDDQWILDAIEYSSSANLQHALSSLGHLEVHGLNQLKYGL